MPSASAPKASSPDNHHDDYDDDNKKKAGSPDKMLEDELEDGMVCPRHPLQKLLHLVEGKHQYDHNADHDQIKA